ncbi:class I SAM-dependent DNA methyltransferase [Piscirickettsia litoralis]|uniref:Methyltransferase domain-containing protein n=1 Tax=Piscirickettsia litoralis TaxID=1891921 RepID=A0ABX3A3F0_9GAMM|nr:methyltransferase domain-containing protein [Piscirickettsia litoralis]ODN43407.1 hypothetical protein BGC07_11350 [Piscirickettsia litoralis]
MVKSIKGEKADLAPKEYIEKLFDGEAENFEHHLVDQLHYCLPKKIGLLAVNLLQHLPVAEGKVALDLGCGTGLIGQALKPWVAEIHGVDLSKKMLDQAKKKEIYSQLVQGDILEFLEENHLNKNYHLITAVDVFVYLGVLEKLFSAVACRLAQAMKSVFLFSVELLEDDQVDYQLLPTGRYAHSLGYLKKLSAEHGFTVSHVEPTSIREERGQPVPGVIMVLNLS